MINSSPRALVYGYLSDQETFAFADAATAAAEAQEITAIAGARTWGEARGVTVRHVGWNPADAEHDDEGHDEDAPFDITGIGPVMEGDWPPMVASRAFELLPEDLQAEYGTVADTSLNGDYLEISPAAEIGLIGALRGRGHQVHRDDALMETLNGTALHS